MVQDINIYEDCSQIPEVWKESCVNSECTLHQLSPYIGKLKSKIAQNIILTYSKEGDLVVDPFSGSGTVPLEARLLNRRAYASDISPYAGLLSRAKLFAPPTVADALDIAKLLLSAAKIVDPPDLSLVPEWVKRFFHPQTLVDAFQFSTVCKTSRKYDFIYACFLGILHHQRPGFLSYPSSHLVPYLRDKKFPREQYPEMYEYRELESRLFAKIRRAYKRFDGFPGEHEARFEQLSVVNANLPDRFECLITSPPYMNALDYGRDNRLRLWFIDPHSVSDIDENQSQQRFGYDAILGGLGGKLERSLAKGGYAIFVVGNETSRKFVSHPSQVVLGQMAKYAPSLKLENVFLDTIPDVRRARRDYKGIKSEHFLVFKKGN